MTDRARHGRQSRTLKQQLPYPYNQDLSKVLRGPDMDMLAGIAGLAVGAVTAWAVAVRYATATMSRMQARIRYWQDEAERAKARAAQVSEQAAAWAAGCQQGREYVLPIACCLARQAPACPCARSRGRRG